MARVNRFYLLIASLMMTRVSGALAFDCDFTDTYDDCYGAHAGGGFYYTYPASKYHPDMEDLCPIDSWENTVEGNLTSDSYCPEGAAIEANVISFCCANPNLGISYEDCMAWSRGDAQCSGGGGGGSGEIEPTIPTCIDGYYLDNASKECMVCPVYSYDSQGGNKNFTGIKGGGNNYPDPGSGNISTCYVPKNITFTDVKGTYFFANDCNYYAGT